MRNTSLLSWAWVALCFGLQLLGCLLLVPWVGIDFREVAYPAAVLVCGSVTAAFFTLRPATEAIERRMRWFPALLYSLFIFALSSRPYTFPQPTPIDLSFLHTVIYASLAFLLAMAWDRGPVPLRPTRILLPVFLLGALYGVLDEFHQSFVPGRMASAGDVVFDIIGLICGSGVFLLCRRLGWLSRGTGHQETRRK
jgi:VanZ family protein